MPEKYQIHTTPLAPRTTPIGKLGIVDWREDCSRCHNCVKRSCVYRIYEEESATLRQDVGYIDYLYHCKGCLTCVQNCTKGILTRVVNPEYERLGDDHYTPDILLTTWYQAETGRIPVSGSGYGGPFSGPGFDSMWTDMSEIVRPTRDGIHGREYIHTGIEMGRKLPHLAFKDGSLTSSPPPRFALPMPILFDVVPAQWSRGIVPLALCKAAESLGLLAVVRPPLDFDPGQAKHARIMPWIDETSQSSPGPDAPIVMISDNDGVRDLSSRLKKDRPDRIVSIRVPAGPETSKRVLELVDDGAEVIHLVFDTHGKDSCPEHPRHMRDVLREVHLALVQAGTRDQVTLVASGGIALAEHVTKAMLCGADAVAIDIPLLLALECRLCNECARGAICPIDLDGIQLDDAVHRIVNLMGAWHQQLIEMLGAMGLREARRLRGEVGRCMFFEDLEKASFGRLFGPRKVKARSDES